MSEYWPIGVLSLLVAGLLALARQPACQSIFKWLPIPLWCYLLPMVLGALGWLPIGHPAYRGLTNGLLPFALALVLLGVDLPAVWRTGSRALLVTLIGAASIVVGTAVGVCLLRSLLPPDAWKGAGALAATWTGGTMNLLAMRVILETPDSVFAPLVVVDAVVAYSWMALLVAASALQDPLNRWLRSPTQPHSTPPPEPPVVGQAHESHPGRWRSLLVCGLIALALAWGSSHVATHLPATSWVSSGMGWTVLIVTSAALALSFTPSVRRVGAGTRRLGYGCLYLVLAATGAQASLEALGSAPGWLVLGFGVAMLHGGCVLVAGRFLRLPIGLLATASQANIGGLVSAPLVGAVYHHSLIPVGLLLAIGCNAVGTYLGLGAAMLAHALVGGG